MYIYIHICIAGRRGSWAGQSWSVTICSGSFHLGSLDATSKIALNSWAFIYFQFCTLTVNMQQRSWSQQVPDEESCWFHICLTPLELHPTSWNFVLSFSGFTSGYQSPRAQIQSVKQPATASTQFLGEKKASPGFTLPIADCKLHHMWIFALSFHCVCPQILSQNLCPKIKKKLQQLLPQRRSWNKEPVLY